MIRREHNKSVKAAAFGGCLIGVLAADGWLAQAFIIQNDEARFEL